MYLLSDIFMWYNHNIKKGVMLCRYLKRKKEQIENGTKRI